LRIAASNSSLPKRIVWDLRKLGAKFGIAEKEMDGAENEVHDASHENSPVGADAGIL
jgi:hypothetical protein